MDKERLFRYLDRNYCSRNDIIPNIPLGVDPDTIWSEILQSRRERGIELPLKNVNGDNYWYILTSRMISASEVIVDELMEQETTVEPHNNTVSTIEEIYYTGFLEGAQISVQDAMRFLQSGEEPENVEELILLNSRQAAVDSPARKVLDMRTVVFIGRCSSARTFAISSSGKPPSAFIRSIGFTAVPPFAGNPSAFGGYAIMLLLLWLH